MNMVILADIRSIKSYRKYTHSYHTKTNGIPLWR